MVTTIRSAGVCVLPLTLALVALVCPLAEAIGPIQRENVTFPCRTSRASHEEQKKRFA
jgi:hypothetical protein